MGRKKLTVSVPEELAEYLQSKPNVSAVVAEAVRAYRARELDTRLEEAYREGAAESARLNAEWRAADAEVPE
jgi:post-segregation antitoxin (ccd killing protein)